MKNKILNQLLKTQEFVELINNGHIACLMMMMSQELFLEDEEIMTMKEDKVVIDSDGIYLLLMVLLVVVNITIKANKIIRIQDFNNQLKAN